MEERDEKEVAKILAGFYEKEFYGKKSGKYRIKKSQIAALAGKEELKKDFRDQLKDELSRLGYIWVKFGQEVTVVEAGPLIRCRAVNKDMIAGLTGKKKKVVKSNVKKRRKNQNRANNV